MSLARLARAVPAFSKGGRNQKGFAIAFAMVMFLLLAGLTYMSTATTGRTIKTAAMSRDFVESGQLADIAIQDAVYQLNEAAASFPTAGTVKSGSTPQGTWTWYLDGNITPGLGGGRTAVIRATGKFRNVTRNVTATAGSLNVGGFKVMPDNQLQYEESPAAAFTHTVLGRSVKVQNGAGVGGATPFLKGTVGVNGPGPLDLANYGGTTSPSTAAYLLYGGQAANLNVDGATKIPAGIGLDGKFVTDNLVRCGGAAPAPWTASRSGGVINANDNVGCYSSMTFDVPTTIIGGGAFNAFVTGPVVFNDSAQAATAGTALNIYTSGAVTFNTTLASAGPMTLNNTFIFAPAGACTTSPFRDPVKGLTFTGSLACDTVNVAGSFAGAVPVNPLGNDATKDVALYSREIWFLTDYKQPAGKRS
ncbi:MAG TPA: hypothetical protein VF867_01150 [Arthrobacter sp.]